MGLEMLITVRDGEVCGVGVLGSTSEASSAEAVV